MHSSTVIALLLSAHTVSGFQFAIPSKTTIRQSSPLYAQLNNDEESQVTSSRRSILNQMGATCAATFLSSSLFSPLPSFAEEATTATTATAAEVNTLPMKNFIDPKGLFALRVPQNFYTLRRTVKGDLPDAKTGKGRRGSSIFTAGDMAKAEVVAVELFPTRTLLEDEGIDASGDLSSFDKLGQPFFLVNLLMLRREKEKPGQTKTVVVKDSVRMSEDKKSLYFELRSDVDVQKPELLMEQMGVSELHRITLGRAELRSGNGQMMVCYASALDIDYDKGDGAALREVIDSFVAFEQKPE